MSQTLLPKLEGPLERVGFILKSGEIVEVPNVCAKPEEGFDVSGEDIVKYADTSVATWHTHPGGNNNLSVSDFNTFLNWPELDHYIVGTNGVRRYYVEQGEVLIG